MFNNKNVKPFIEFNITEKCNYCCEYCSQGFLNKKEPEKLKNASDEVCDGLIKLLKILGKEYVVQLIGGEPFCSPNFFNLVKQITSLGNKIIVVTNMSFPISSFQKLVDIAQDKLLRIHGSIHIAQIKDLDKNIEKLIEIKKILNPNTEYRIMSLLLEDNFKLLKSINQKLRTNNVEFVMARLIENGKPNIYNKEIEDYLKQQNHDYEKNIVKSASINTENVLCYAGSKILHINTSGDVMRCWSYQSRPNFQILGNLKNVDNIKLLKNAMPCYAKKCACSYPTEKNAYFYSNLTPFYRFEWKFFLKKTFSVRNIYTEHNKTKILTVFGKDFKLKEYK